MEYHIILINDIYNNSFKNSNLKKCFDINPLDEDLLSRIKDFLIDDIKEQYNNILINKDKFRKPNVFNKNTNLLASLQNSGIYFHYLNFSNDFIKNLNNDIELKNYINNYKSIDYNEVYRYIVIFIFIIVLIVFLLII